MRSLGVNPAGGVLWLACAEAGRVLDLSPYSVSLASGLEASESLIAFVEESERVLRDLAPDRVLLLDPETNAKFAFSAVRVRVTGETLFAFAAAKAGVACERLTRPTVRTRLSLPRSGSLESHVGTCVPSPLAPHWKKKRDLAALAALAAQKPAD